MVQNVNKLKFLLLQNLPLLPQYISIRHRVTAMQDGAKVDLKSCNHFEKRSVTASDWGGQSEAKTTTSCNSGLSITCIGHIDFPQSV